MLAVGPDQPDDAPRPIRLDVVTHAHVGDAAAVRRDLRIFDPLQIEDIDGLQGGHYGLRKVRCGKQQQGRGRAHPNARATHNGFRSVIIIFSRAGHPAVTLMLIDDAHSLHESVANGRSRRNRNPRCFKSLLMASLSGVDAAISPKYSGRRRSTLPLRELPDVAVEGAEGPKDLRYASALPMKASTFSRFLTMPGSLQQAPAFRGIVAGHFLGVEIVEGRARR